jgi:hypothetical protein
MKQLEKWLKGQYRNKKKVKVGISREVFLSWISFSSSGEVFRYHLSIRVKT